MTTNESVQQSRISVQDLMVLGLEEMAYVKAIAGAEGVAYAVHAADGTQVAIMPSRQAAFAAIREHDLEPVSVH